MKMVTLRISMLGMIKENLRSMTVQVKSKDIRYFRAVKMSIFNMLRGPSSTVIYSI
jgi:hypothetical protein